MNQEVHVVSTKNISDPRDSKTWVPSDLWLIIMVMIIAGVSAWNSRHILFPPPRGYTRFASYGLSFLYPEDMHLWQVPINDGGSETRDGTRIVSENWGDAGWYSGNVDTETQEDGNYFQQSGVLWVAKGQPENLQETLNLFYTKAGSVAERRNREIRIVTGYTRTLRVCGHKAVYQYFNYTQIEAGETLPTVIWGIVGGWYCDNSGRMITLYYEEWYTEDPIYDKNSLYNSFEFYLDSVRCH